MSHIADNFYKYGEIDVSAYQAVFAAGVPWDNEYSRKRKQTFKMHSHVDVLPLMWSFQTLLAEAGVVAPKTEFYETYYKDEFFSALSELIKNDGKFVRLLFTKLPAGTSITPHVDNGPSLCMNKRVHIPIISDPHVIFTVGGEDRYLRPGEVVEINNSVVHSVSNQSDVDRIHLIADWNSHD